MSNNMEQQFKYFAFISYNSKDTNWGKKIQKKLEHYRMPATICSEHNWKRRPISPVFFAPTDIQPGGLNEELQERLRASRNLIVICSPNSAKSEWVGKEIEFFHNLGRTKNIYFFIVDGVPHSGDPETECFNPVVNTIGLPEILGANIHEKVHRLPWLNRERAYVQLISKLLGIEFDAIWQRHKRLLARKIAAFTFGALVVLAALLGIWKNSQPFDAGVRLNEASVFNVSLPPLEDAVVTMTLDNETKSDTLRTIDSELIFNNIPHKFINKQVHFNVSCRDFIDVDTVVVLTRNTVLDIRRNPSVYGDIHFYIWNPDKEEFVANAEIMIDGHEVVSDADGLVMLQIPLASQKSSYVIETSIPLKNNVVTMPCGENDVVLTK